jgi:hypothetical protein
MAEKSLFWFTDGFTGATGDGAAPYTQDEFTFFTRASLGEGVVTDTRLTTFEEPLLASGTSSPLSVTAGEYILDGFFYRSDAPISIAVPTPIIGTTGGRVVLRADYATATVRMVLKMNTDGIAALPAITDTAGVIKEANIAGFTITTGGVINITVGRVFCRPGIVMPRPSVLEWDGLNRLTVADGGITAAKLANDAVTTDKILDSAVTAAKITNRTRTFFVPARSTETEVGYGNSLADGVVNAAQGVFVVPNDYASDMKISAVLQAQASGNIYADTNTVKVTTAGGAAFPAFSFSETAVAMTVNHISFLYEKTIAGLAVGDFCTVAVRRDANSVLDTINNTVVALGFLITYTADS